MTCVTISLEHMWFISTSFLKCGSHAWYVNVPLCSSIVEYHKLKECNSTGKSWHEWTYGNLRRKDRSLAMMPVLHCCDALCPSWGFASMYISCTGSNSSGNLSCFTILIIWSLRAHISGPHPMAFSVYFCLKCRYGSSTWHGWWQVQLQVLGHIHYISSVVTNHKTAPKPYVSRCKWQEKKSARWKCITFFSTQQHYSVVTVDACRKQGSAKSGGQHYLMHRGFIGGSIAHCFLRVTNQTFNVRLMWVTTRHVSAYLTPCAIAHLKGGYSCITHCLKTLIFFSWLHFG